MILKSLARGAAAAAIVGGAALGVTSLSLTAAPVAAASPVVFDVPLQPPPANEALAAEFTRILTTLANGGSITANEYLIQGGVGPIEGRTADRLLRNAAQSGYLPLNISVDPGSIVQTGNTATAMVTASGPQLAPVSQGVTFISNGTNWQLSKASATSLIQRALATG